MTTRVLLPTSLATLLLASAPGPATGADATPAADTIPPGEWDSPRALELADATIRARSERVTGGSLRSYRAEAQGHVYYLAIAGADAETRVVRADQVALRVLWQAPDRHHQTIVGRRHEDRIPTDLRYHIDHLALIPDYFGDRIRMGEGTEVRDVPHPAAPGAPAHYSYRLADSLGMTVAGEETRLYRLEVRPRDPEAPGIAGDVYVEATRHALVRMRFTFTAAAYRDPRLEEIRVDLRSALWEGRHWLPAEQRIEIRRSVPWLDLPLAGVIRTRFVVTDYELNPELGVDLPGEGRIVSLPEERLRRFSAWEEGLYAGPIDEAAAEDVDLEEVRRRAGKLVAERHLAGSAPAGLHVPDLSSAFRLRRAEGALVGGGGRARIGAGELTGWAGVPFETGRVEWRVAYGSAERPAVGVHASVFANRYTDIGPFPAAAGVVSTLGFAVGTGDFTDPFFRDGAEAGVSVADGGRSLAITLAAERHESARLAAGAPLGGEARPVRPITPGDLVALRLRAAAPLGRLLSTSWRGRYRAELAPGSPGDFAYGRHTLLLEGRSAPGGRTGWEVRAGLAAATGSPPPQRLLLLGGRGTVPGHAFRTWGGDAAGYLAVSVSRDLIGPWLGLRALAALGWAGLPGGADEAAETLGVEPSGGLRPSVGAGIGLVDGVLRLEVARGLEDGRWEWMVSADPRFWEVL